MTCRQIQERILERSERTPDLPMDESIEVHLSTCTDCQAWLDELQILRRSLSAQLHPSAAPELVMKTRSLCHDRIDGKVATHRRFRFSEWTRPIPGFIKWVLPALVIITFGWILGTVGDLEPDVAPTAPAVIGLVLIIQNAAMLLFAPILLKRRRIRNFETRI